MKNNPQTKKMENNEPTKSLISSAQCIDYISEICNIFQVSGMSDSIFDALTLLEDHAIQSQISRKK